MNHKVDILVPVYGAAAYIERCAKSVLEQSYSNIAFYFLDDASPDASVAILEKCILRYPEREIHLLHHSENRGLAASRLDLIENSSSDYILQVDADDFLDRDAVEQLVSVIKQTEAEIVGMDCWFEWANQKKAYSAIWSEDSQKYTQILLSAQSLANVCRHLIRRDLYTRNGIHPIPDLNVGEDFLVLPQLTQHAARIGYVAKPLYHYWQANENSYTHQRSETHIESLVKVCQHLYNTFSTNPIYKDSLHIGMWKKKAELMMQIQRRHYSKALDIPTALPIPYSTLNAPQKIAAWLIGHRHWLFLSIYSNIYKALFYIFQKIKGR